MLFPITIFPCVPFASDIFLINDSAETESSCPLVSSVHKQYRPHHVVLRPPVLAQEPTKSGCLFSIPGAYLTQLRQSTCVACGRLVCGSLHPGRATGSLKECPGLRSSSISAHCLCRFFPGCSTPRKETDWRPVSLVVSVPRGWLPPRLRDEEIMGHSSFGRYKLLHIHWVVKSRAINQLIFWFLC